MTRLDSVERSNAALTTSNTTLRSDLNSLSLDHITLHTHSILESRDMLMFSALSVVSFLLARTSPPKVYSASEPDYFVSLYEGTWLIVPVETSHIERNGSTLDSAGHGSNRGPALAGVYVTASQRTCLYRFRFSRRTDQTLPPRTGSFSLASRFFSARGPQT